jgi:hypothetical protein|tara:strand:- start:2662 stop:4281 length:1620 start_codon:yes stop_codon:yes gene_type:complete
MSKKQEHNEYRNKSIFNQRGASIDVNNSTDREEIKISQYSGSNITLNNLVNSELATNNKQITTINDSFESTGKTKSTFTGKDKIERVVENTYSLKGFKDQGELDQINLWKSTYEPVAKANSKFQIQRGGTSFPNGDATNKEGSRGDNSTLNQDIAVPDYVFENYGPIPKRDSSVDEVVSYTPVTPLKGKTPETKQPDPLEDVPKGNVVYEEGFEKNAATEDGDWAPTPEHEELPETIKKLQDDLNLIEQKTGNGGDIIDFTKRNKTQTVGAAFNDYPSVRIDPKGRSQPQEVVVGKNLTFVNVGAAPHVEEVDNNMNFPAGNYTLTVGNKYNVLVGSGGVQLKSTGSVEIAGTSNKIIGEKVNITGKSGVSISSNSNVEIAGVGNDGHPGVQIRSNKQVFIEPGLGVKNNITSAGGVYAEGELFVHHVTAPIEIQETEDTLLYGRFNTDLPRRLLIAETEIGGSYFPVYALPLDDLIVNYPHSHHFNNIPLRLMNSNTDVRDVATREGINTNGYSTQALEVRNERKRPLGVQQTQTVIE